VTATSTLPSEERGFGFSVEFDDPATFGLADVLASPDLLAAVEDVYKAFLQNETTPQQYSAIVGLTVSLTNL